MQMSPEMDTVIIKSKGNNEKTYDDFYIEMTGYNHSIALMWVKVEDFLQLFTFFYAGEGANGEFLEIMDELEDEVKTGVYFEGIGVTLAYDKKDLVLENVLQKNRLVFAQRDVINYDYFIEVPEFENFYEKAEEYNNKKINLPDNIFDHRIENAVNDMKLEGKNKYVMSNFDQGRLRLEDAGDISYENLKMKLLREGNKIPKILFYKFEYENKEQIVCLLISKVIKLDNGKKNVIQALKTALTEVAIPLYPIIEPDYFDLDILINIGAIPDPDFRIHINNDLVG